MPSAPKRQAAARAARNIHHQYSTPFVPLPYHPCDHRSTAGRYEQDPAFKAGGYAYRSYADQVPDDLGHPIQDSGRAGAGASVNRIAARGGRRDAGPREAKLRTSSFPYDQYLVDTYDTSPKKTGGRLSSHDATENKDKSDQSGVAPSPEEPNHWLLRSPSPLNDTSHAILVPETPPSNPCRSPHNFVDGSSSLSEPSAPAPPRVQTPLIRSSQLIVHTPPGSPLQWWADLSQLPIPEEAREDDLEVELRDKSPGAEEEVDNLQSKRGMDIDAEGEIEAANPTFGEGLGASGFEREGNIGPATIDSASDRPTSTSPEQLGSRGARTQLSSDASIRPEQADVSDIPFRPRSAAFHQAGRNTSNVASMVPHTSGIHDDERENGARIIELRQAWLDLTRAHDRMKEIMEKIDRSITGRR